jgi:hypothetical protein
MKAFQFVGISIISGVAGIILSQLILPSIVSTFQGTFDSLNIVDASNLISWAAILITIVGLIFAILLLAKNYNVGPLLLCLSISFVFTIILLSTGSFIYLGYTQPNVFADASIITKLVKFYTYPTMISLLLGDMQPIWIISTVLFLIIFNTSFFYLTGGFK